jgi:trk system potassium uptake protein TrkA
MKIVVVGAGAVGSYLATRLALEGQDVILVESNPARAEAAQGEIDCMVVNGNGASATILRRAGLADAELLIAVTSSDAINVLACHAANTLGIPRKVARIEDAELKAEVEELGVDLIIDPGEAASRELLSLIKRGAVSDLVSFADGRLILMGTFVPAEAAFVGRPLAEIREDIDDWSWLVVAVIRHGVTIIADGSTVIAPHDHVLLMTRASTTAEAYRMLGISDKPARKVIILGGTRLAQMTASLLTRNGITTTLIDGDRDRCRYIAERNADVITVHGDPTDPRVLASEGVATADCVLALSGWDGDNLLGSLVAKELGAGEAIARFMNTDLVGILGGAGLDATVSARMSAANEILRFVRRGVIYSVATFSDSDAEAIELEVGPNSPAIDVAVNELRLPPSLLIGGIQRGSDAFVPRGSTVIRRGDHLIVIALPEAIAAAESLSG